MAETEDQLRQRMVMTFRVSELQMLLGYAGKNKTGRKNELQSRAIELVRLRNPSIQQKIKELYKSIQLEMMSFGDRSGQGAPVAGAPGLHPSQKVPMGLGSIAGYPQASVGAIASANSASRYAASNAQVSASMAQGGVAYSGLTSHGQSSYPINPDVKLKRLPFYDILGELLKPSSLAPQGSGRYQEAGFSFSLTPQQANKIANSRDLRPGKQDYTVQVQMRFCLLETTCEQDDNFPPNIAVKINEKMCPLPSPIPTNKPGVEPKRPSRPVNVTALCRISPTVTNRINVSWASEYGRCYVISVYLVQKLSSDDLLSRLKNKGARIADFTRSLIKQKLQEDADCEIATTSLRCSLQCPLGKMRMMLPARSTTCDHLQCFDASLFLQMNERKPTWTCPVCDKTATYDNLVIDGYFQEVLQKASNCSEVSLDKTGDWTPLIPKKEPKEEVVKRKPEVQCETLDSDSDDNGNDDGDASIVEEAAPKKSAPVVVDCITLSDSEDEDGPPPAKRPNNGTGMSSASIAAANTPAPTPTAEAGDNTTTATTGGSSTPGVGGGGGAVTPPGHGNVSSASEIKVDVNNRCHLITPTPGEQMEVNKKPNIDQNRRNGICSNLKSLRMTNNTLKDVIISSDFDTVKTSSSKNYSSKDSPKSNLLQIKVNKKSNTDLNRRNGICSNLKSLRISKKNKKDEILSTDSSSSKDSNKSYLKQIKSCYVYIEKIKNTTVKPKSVSTMKLHDANESEISERYSLRNRRKPVSLV